jgi:hypothetical protein
MASLCLKLVGAGDEAGKAKAEWSVYGLSEPTSEIASLEVPKSTGSTMLPPELASWAKWRDSVLEFQLTGETEFSLLVESATEPLMFNVDVY